MANPDKPISFSPVFQPGQVPKTEAYEVAAAQTWSAGDLLTMNSSGQIELATASSGALCGLAVNSIAAPAQGTRVLVYDDPNQLFYGQCSGTFAITMLGSDFDIEGTTGAQEINENATLKRVVQIVNYPLEAEGESNAVGANTKVYFKIAKHQFDPMINISSDLSDFGADGLKTDKIAESTSAAGVTIDVLTLVKDGDITSGGFVHCDSDTDGLKLGDDAGVSIVAGAADVVYDNTRATGKHLFKLGSSDANTEFTVEKDDGTDLFTAKGDGSVIIGGSLSALTDDIIIDSDTKGLKLGDDQGVSLIAGAADVTIDNTRATGKIIAKLGTDTNATQFDVQNDSGSAILSVFGDSAVVVSVADNEAVALDITQGANSYLAIDTTNSKEAVVFGKRTRESGGANVEALAGDKTLVVTDAKYQKLDPGGAHRDVNLPAEADSTGLEFFIANAADNAENLVVKNDGAGTIATLNQNEAAIFICDGTNWVVMNVITAGLT